MNIVRRPVADGNWHRGRWRDKARTVPWTEIDQITIHVTQGTASSARQWFNDPRADVSAHYLIATTGTIDQFVDEADTAQHNGVVDHPTAPLVLERPGVNPNAWSIGIEHEGDGTKGLTPAQRAASTWLIADIVRRRPSIKLDARHIVPHHAVRRSKDCPGKIDVDALIRGVAAGWAPLVATLAPTVRMQAPQVVWSDYLHDWLVIVRVVSDTEWYFVPAKSLGAAQGLTRAAAPLSQMPRAA